MNWKEEYFSMEGTQQKETVSDFYTEACYTTDFIILQRGLQNRRAEEIKMYYGVKPPLYEFKVNFYDLSNDFAISHTTQCPASVAVTTISRTDGENTQTL